MFVSREEALAAHQARHKLRTTRNGEAWLFAPYMPSASYSLGHYTNDGWQQCPGAGACLWHHRKLIPKMHVASVVIRKPLLYVRFATCAPPKVVHFTAGEWDQKIVELTGGVIDTFTKPATKPDQLCIVARAPGRNTLPLELRWLDAVLQGVPKEICEMRIVDMLPAIIKSDVVVSATVSDLDNPPDGRTEHKNPYQTTEVENSVAGVQGEEIPLPGQPATRIGRSRKRKVVKP